MMGIKEREFRPLPDNLSLEELVPQDNFYRHQERAVDIYFVRELVKDRYAWVGRPSVDPVVFFKLQLVLFFEDLRSERTWGWSGGCSLGLSWGLSWGLSGAVLWADLGTKQWGVVRIAAEGCSPPPRSGWQPPSTPLRIFGLGDREADLSPGRRRSPLSPQPHPATSGEHLSSCFVKCHAGRWVTSGNRLLSPYRLWVFSNRSSIRSVTSGKLLPTTLRVLSPISSISSLLS
jgi:hypothetical protein